MDQCFFNILLLDKSLINCKNNHILREESSEEMIAVKTECCGH